MSQPRYPYSGPSGQSSTPWSGYASGDDYGPHYSSSGWTAYDPYWANPYAGGPLGTPPPPEPRSRPRRFASLAGLAAAVAAAVVGVSIAGGAATSVDGTGTAAGQQPGSSSQPGAFPGTNGGGGSSGSGGGSSGNGSPSTGVATARQQIGVVDVDTRLEYQQAAAAGTGIVIDSGGYVLTNNHVIDQSTSIRVTVVASGKTYTARVVGTAPTQDIAVLKLQNASGLQTARLGNSDAVKVGDPITGVGNAGGSGGTPSAAKGTIQALDETITASDESGTDSERLNGVIATDAPIKAGDSGGPLFDAGDQVIGIDTAASTGSQLGGQSAGYAIPINKAMSIAKQIRSGQETSVIHIGYPAFLGVGVQNAPGAGALITSVEPGLPADKAGISTGDIITSLNGSRVSSANTLRTAIRKVNPGDTVGITYTDATGATHNTRATLITGPAD